MPGKQHAELWVLRIDEFFTCQARHQTDKSTGSKAAIQLVAQEYVSDIVTGSGRAGNGNL